MTVTSKEALVRRPALPAIPARIRWRGTLVCVVGSGATGFADVITRRLRERGVPARGLRVQLRHATGATLEGEPDAVLSAHPDALLTELPRAQPGDERAITVGAGLPLAAAAEPDLLVWIRGDERESALDPDTQAVVREAALVLEDAREETATALADALLQAR